MKPDFSTQLERGMKHFNALQFWEAHEAWEEIWLVAESDVEQFLQGLIQLAAGAHRVVAAPAGVGNVGITSAADCPSGPTAGGRTSCGWSRPTYTRVEDTHVLQIGRWTLRVGSTGVPVVGYPGQGGGWELLRALAS